MCLPIIGPSLEDRAQATLVVRGQRMPLTARFSFHYSDPLPLSPRLHGIHRSRVLRLYSSSTSFRVFPCRSRSRHAGLWSLSQSLNVSPGCEWTSSPQSGHSLPAVGPSSASDYCPEDSLRNAGSRAHTRRPDSARTLCQILSEAFSTLCARTNRKRGDEKVAWGGLPDQ